MSTTYGPHPFPTADEIGGFWAFDKMHAPRPITPLSGAVILPTMSDGFTDAQAEYDSPMVIQDKWINYHYFAAFGPHTDADIVADRLSRYEDTLAAKFPLVGPRWENEWKPALITMVEQNKRDDWSGLTNAELRDKFDWFSQHQYHQWYIHGHINFALMSAAAFCDMYDDIMSPVSTTESYECLQGYRTRSVDAANALWNLSRHIRHDETLSDAFRTSAPKELTEILGQTPAGKAFLGDFDAFLFEFGWRSDAVYDMADITWREDPSIPLGALRGYIDRPDAENPEHHLARSTARREELMIAARAAIANDPHRAAAFERQFEAASYNLPLTEDHAFWIDQCGIAVFRRFVLEIGSRLVTNGALDQVDDVHYLFPHELKAALIDGTNYRADVAQRRAEMVECAKLDVPPFLGTPPLPPAPGEKIDPFLEAVAVRLLGLVPPTENTDPNLIVGVAGSKGIVTGTARVMKSLAEASDVDEGDIVVCEMTLPPWVPLFSIAAAFVTDTGGVLSHCAIVAREVGLPAVVGTQIGTIAIKTGQTLTVDGNAGTIRIHA
jgi:phosphohistidine swiveling domain-containing protein